MLGLGVSRFAFILKGGVDYLYVDIGLLPSPEAETAGTYRGYKKLGERG